MSQLLYQWLNDEIQLSTKVKSFEKDFSNGFLFGELLSKYNQQLNFDEFQNKQLRSAKIKNFQLLQPTFKTLNINFDTKVVDSIIKESNGITIQILYQLKMALEKVNDPADVLIHSKNGKYNAIVPLKRIQQPKEQFDKMESQFFERRLNELNRAQKEVNLDEHQEKFERFKQQQEEKIKKLKDKDEFEQRTLKEEMRKISLNKLQRNMAFMEDWNQKGIENWKKNQDVRKKTVKNDINFKQSFEERTKKKLDKLQDLNQIEMIEEIEQFENSLKKMGLSNEQIDDQFDQRQAVSTSPIQVSNHHQTSSVSAVRVHHQSKIVSEFLRKERDKRRRKMIVDQEKQHGELRRREQAVLQKLKQQSRQENEILYEVWRAYKCKDIIIQNRKLRDEKYRQKQELNVINIKYKEEEMLRTIRQEYKVDLEAQLQRERELNVQQKLNQRQANYENCGGIVQVLIQMTEFLYDFQQTVDSSNTENYFLENCYELFISGNKLIPHKEFRTSDPIPQIKKQQNQYLSEKDYLADYELKQYINGLGQWAPKHQQITGEGVNAGDLELDDKLLPSKPQNNKILGNLVRLIIQKSYQGSNAQITRPKNIPYLPFKCALIGQTSSGKRSIAELIQKKYGIQVISIDGVVSELMELLRRFQERERIRQQQQQQQLQQQQQQQSLPENLISKGSISQTSQKLSDASPSQQYFWDEEMLELARQVHERLIQGNDIPDELYVQIVCFKIRKLFPPKPYEAVVEDFNKIRSEWVQQNKAINNQTSYRSISSGEEDLGSEIEGFNREDFHKKNMNSIRFPYNQGFLLLDFPQTYQQAKILERYLGGFRPDDEIEKSQLQLRLEQAERIVRGDTIILKQRQAIEGGIPLVIYMSMPGNKSSLQRSLGQRYDPYTKSMFHLDDNPPPVDNAPLIERLEVLYTPSSLQQPISDKNVFFNSKISQLEEWYGNFETSIMFNSNDGQQIHRTLKTFQKIDANKRIEDVFFRLDQLITQMLELFELQIFSEQQKKQQIALMKIQEQEVLKAQLEQEQKIQPTEYKIIQEKLNGAIQSQDIPDKGIQIFNSFWEKIEASYLKITKLYFRNTYEQKQLIFTRISDIEKKFINLLIRYDEKFFIVQKFQEQYNNFANDNPDMLEEDQTKEELHQRVEDLADNLSDLVEQKRDDALEERRKNLEFGWIESEMDYFIQQIQRLLQAELDRTNQSIQLITDYYILLDGRELQDLAQDSIAITEISIQQDQLPPIESSDDSNSFPRIEKIIFEILRIFNGEEDQNTIDDKNKKGGKGNKKEEKKAPTQNKKGVKEVEEVKREVSAIEQEGLRAINTEKAIFRYRVQVIKDFAINALKEMRKISKSLLQRMEEWTYYTYYCELDAIKVISQIFKKAIEKEEKIQNEIQLNFVDVVISHKTLNFLTPKPQPLPAREPINSKRLSISQLYYIIEDLRAITSNQMTIEAKQLALVLGRKQQSLQKEDLCETLHISTNQWFKVMSKLSKQGYVPVRTICTYLILLNSPIITLSEKNNYEQSLQQNAIDDWLKKDQFVNTYAWFDAYEGVPEEHNTNYFDRALYIKELLFFVHKDPDQELLHIPSLLEVLQIKETRNSRTYYEYLLSS